MLTVSDINSTFESSEINSNQEKSNQYKNEFYMYNEKIIVDSPILRSYVPRIITNYNERFKREIDIYHKELTPTSIFRAFDSELNEKIVLKELRKSKLVTNYMHEFAKNELAIHFSLSNYTNCENIVKVREYFENSDAYYMVMEYSPEPNFFEDLLEVKYRAISDEDVLKAFALDILNGLVEIHKNNIIHCDIKPQNFLLFYDDGEYGLEYLKNNKEIGELINSCSYDSLSVNSYDPNSFLKITDFGLSHLIPLGQTKAYMKFRCGTFGYNAPEVNKESLVDTSIDMWSFGLCLYQMAVAYLPTAIKQYKYGSGDLPFRKIDWNGFNFDKIKNLIESCVQIRPEKRITAFEAINHPWFDSE